jgi:hypothetical protein
MKIQDVDPDQRLEISKINALVATNGPKTLGIWTLVGTNVFFLRFSRHWFRPMSGKQQNRDVRRSQRLQNLKKETLVITNVDRFPESGHWS